MEAYQALQLLQNEFGRQHNTIVRQLVQAHVAGQAANADQAMNFVEGAATELRGELESLVMRGYLYGESQVHDFAERLNEQHSHELAIYAHRHHHDLVHEEGAIATLRRDVEARSVMCSSFFSFYSRKSSFPAGSWRILRQVAATPVETAVRVPARAAALTPQRDQQNKLGDTYTPTF